jgi:hypothetical protein
VEGWEKDKVTTLVRRGKISEVSRLLPLSLMLLKFVFFNKGRVPLREFTSFCVMAYPESYIRTLVWLRMSLQSSEVIHCCGAGLGEKYTLTV